MGRADNSVTDMSFSASSEQGRQASRMAHTVSFSNAWFSVTGKVVLPNLPPPPSVTEQTRKTSKHAIGLGVDYHRDNLTT